MSETILPFSYDEADTFLAELTSMGAHNLVGWIAESAVSRPELADSLRRFRKALPHAFKSPPAQPEPVRGSTADIQVDETAYEPA